MDAGGQGRGKCYEVGGANWQEGGGMQITEQDEPMYGFRKQSPQKRKI